MKCLLAQAAERFSSYPAIVTPRRKFSFEEWDRIVAATALRLRRNGIKRGTRVAIRAPNNFQYICILLALWRLQAVACLLNIREPFLKLCEQLQDLNIRHIISADGKFLKQFPNDACFHFNQLILNSPSKGAAVSSTIPLHHPATILFTSGSTGQPKAVVHTFGNHYYSALGSNENIPVGPGDRWLLALPLYHVSGLSIIFRCLIAGAAVVLPEKKNDFLKTIERFQITHLSLVAVQLSRLLNEQRNPQRLSKIKAILVGGGPIPPELIERARARHWPIVQTYGLTEMSSQVATSVPNNVENIRTLRYRELKISKEHEIWVRGKTLFKGYIRGGKLVRPFQKDGWFKAGDLGKFDPMKGLRILGRKDDMFISGGENIYPQEIERYLAAAPGVEEAVVVPCAAAEFGERPVAFIRKKPAQHLSVNTLQKFLSHYLPKFKIPQHYYSWPTTKTFPLKTNRRALREYLGDPRTHLRQIK